MNRKKIIFLSGITLILALSFLLKVQQFNNFLVPDEETILEMVWGLHSNPLPPKMPPPLPGYPPLFIYLNFLLSVIYGKIAVFLGFFSSYAEFLNSESARFFALKAGQIIVTLLSLLQLIFIWKTGKEFFSEKIAWLATLIIAFHPHFILNSRIFKSDMLLALLFTIISYLLLKFLTYDKPAFFYRAAFLAGAAVAAKYNGISAIFLIPLVLIIAKKKNPLLSFKMLIPAGLSALAGFLVSAPNWLFYPVSNFKQSFQYVWYHFNEFSFFDSQSVTYLKYFQDVWQTLGPILALFFFLGIIFIFIKRNANDLCVLASFLLYLAIQGKSGFFGSRIILPVYSFIVLIISRTILDYVFQLIRKGFIKKIYSAAIIILIANLTFTNLSGSLHNFNLFATTSTLDAAWNFRKMHIPEEFRFARENFTPVAPNDIGKWDLASIPEDFFKKINPNFLTTGLLTSFLLTDSKNNQLKELLINKLKNFRPFHYIQKPAFTPWQGNVIFWYKQHPDLLNFRPASKNIALPRIITNASADTIFLPFQIYEKEQAVIFLQKGFFHYWISCREELEKLEFIIFSPLRKISAAITLNQTTLNIKSKEYIARNVFTHPEKLSRHREILYQLQIKVAENQEQALFLFIPHFKGQKTSPPPFLGSSLQIKLPEIFSANPLPRWVVEFYRKTGIDLTLLTLTQTEALIESFNQCSQIYQSNWQVFKRGVFRIRTEIKPLLKKENIAFSPPPLTVELFDKGKLNRQKLNWEPSEDKEFYTLFTNNSDYCFCRFLISDFKEDLTYLKKLTITPDYRLSLLLLQEQYP